MVAGRRPRSRSGRSGRGGVPHRGQHGAAEQHGALDEEVELVEVVRPRDFGDRGFGLRAGGVEHQHLNRAEAVGDRTNELGDLALVGRVAPQPRELSITRATSRPAWWIYYAIIDNNTRK